jgi:hypothetical protein
VLEMVRPGMEDSESGEKQENTGIGPASACRDSPTPSCVPDAVQRVTEWSGAPLIRDRHRLERFTQVGLARLARIWAPISGKPGIGVCSAPQRNQAYADCVNLSALLRCARDTCKDQPAAVGNDRRLRSHCFRIVIYNGWCNSNVSGGRRVLRRAWLGGVE